MKTIPEETGLPEKTVPLEEDKTDAPIAHRGAVSHGNGSKEGFYPSFLSYNGDRRQKILRGTSTYAIIYVRIIMQKQEIWR